MKPEDRPFGIGQITGVTKATGVHIGRSSKENQAPDKESHPIHQTQELPGSALSSQVTPRRISSIVISLSLVRLAAGECSARWASFAGPPRDVDLAQDTRALALSSAMAASPANLLDRSRA